MENFSTLTGGGYAEEDLVMDGWTEIIGKLLRGMRIPQRRAGGSAIAHAHAGMVDFEKMEQIRARAQALVDDPDTAEALKPYYRQFCKRPCFHDEYLQTFNRPNVTLVDTDGKGIERITQRGIVAGGVEYELDCIIYASGFEVGTPMERRAGYEVYRPRRRRAQREMARRRVDDVRHADARISELLHRRPVAGRREREHSARARRAEPAHRVHPQARARTSGRQVRRDGGSGSRSGFKRSSTRR